MSRDMRRSFSTRDELVAYLAQEFPAAAQISSHVASVRGGRSQAEQRLSEARLRDYASTRSYLDGAVTRLSPFIRYGVLSLDEVRNHALAAAHNPGEVEKFINELAWRDYWQRIYAEIGEAIWEDIEPYKTGFPASEYANELPEDISSGTTGVRFIDDFCHELATTGYLHNHARMWLAAYVVHWRRVRWQAGARWFLQHLLDGDPASNNLSWQWVASTFSHKPYYYNLENVVRYTGTRYQGNPRDFGHEAFEGSYDEIARRLFPRIDLSETDRERPRAPHKGRKP
jgi:deoxyribodipyrimidine photo-lyase